MVFVMILIRINSGETSAACAAGVIFWFVHYLDVWRKAIDGELHYSRKMCVSDIHELQDQKNVIFCRWRPEMKYGLDCTG